MAKAWRWLRAKPPCVGYPKSCMAFGHKPGEAHPIHEGVFYCARCGRAFK